MDRAADWAKRDAAVVWHGFTQMATFTENRPVIVERAEGHELIDVDGRRYLDAISSLWVNTLGHRVPELDDALRDQLDRVAHSTMLGNGNRVVIELAEALARVVPVDGPHFLFAADGAAAVEQALKIAFQYWANRGIAGRTSYLAFGDAYHGDTVGSLSIGAGGFGTDLFDPLRFPVLRAPAFGDPDSLRTAAAMVAAHASSLAAVVVEPLVQGAGGIRVAPAEDFAQLGAACRDHDVLLICDEVAIGFGRTGTLFASEQCGLRPDLLCLGKGLTGGYLPHVGHGRDPARLRRVPRPRPVRAAPCTTATPTAGTRSPRAVALRHLQLLEERDVLGNVRARSTELRALLGTAHRPPSGRGRGPPTGPHGRRRARAAARRPALGAAGLRGRGGTGCAPAPAGRRRRRDAAAHDHEPPSCTASSTCSPMPSTPGPARRRDLARVGRGRGRSHPRRRSLARAPRLRRRRPRGQARPRRPAGRLVRLERLPRPDPAPGRARGRARRRRPLGHPARDRPASSSGSRPLHSELEATLADWKRAERAVLFPTGFAANLGVLTTFGGPGVLVCSDELNHASIIDGCRLSRAPTSRSTATATSTTSTRSSPVATRPGPSSSPTPSSPWTATSPTSTRSPSCAPGTARCSCSTRPTPCSDRTPSSTASTRVRVGTLSKTLGALGGFVAGPAPLHRPRS